MSNDNEKLMQHLIAVLAQNQKAMQAMADAMNKSAAQSGSADSSMIIPGISQTQLMNDIGNRIATFQFDVEADKTFPKWYSRYETAFTGEGKDLDEGNKVSLLVSKLSDDVYDQYTKRICPKKYTEMNFDETIKILEQMFDVKRSLFSHRFTCMSIVRDGESPVEYTSKVNSLCETAMLNDIDAEGWKVFFWLKGLDPSKDTKARTYFLKYVEQKWEKKESISVNDLCEEWQKLLRQNSVILEMEQVEKACRAVHTSSQKGNLGHRAKYCEKRPFSSNSVSIIDETASEDVRVKARRARRHVSVRVNDQLLEFQLDTASDVTFISRNDWINIGEPELIHCSTKVTSASGDVMKLLGSAKVTFIIQGEEFSGTVYVREQGNLLGLDWITKSSRMSHHMDTMVSTFSSLDTEYFREDTKGYVPDKVEKELSTCAVKNAVLSEKEITDSPDSQSQEQEETRKSYVLIQEGIRQQRPKKTPEWKGSQRKGLSNQGRVFPDAGAGLLADNAYSNRMISCLPEGKEKYAYSNKTISCLPEGRGKITYSSRTISCLPEGRERNTYSSRTVSCLPEGTERNTYSDRRASCLPEGKNKDTYRNRMLSCFPEGESVFQRKWLKTQNKRKLKCSYISRLSLPKLEHCFSSKSCGTQVSDRNKQVHPNKSSTTLKKLKGEGSGDTGLSKLGTLQLSTKSESHEDLTVSLKDESPKTSLIKSHMNDENQDAIQAQLSANDSVNTELKPTKVTTRYNDRRRGVNGRKHCITGSECKETLTDGFWTTEVGGKRIASTVGSCVDQGEGLLQPGKGHYVSGRAMCRRQDREEYAQGDQQYVREGTTIGSMDQCDKSTI